MSVLLDPTLSWLDPRLGLVLDWWRGAVAARGHLPGRRDVDPVAMKALLPQIYMVDVLVRPPGRRYRWRLLGTGITGMAGRDSTGRFFDEIYEGEALSNFLRSFDAVVDSARPMRSYGSFAFADNARDYVTFEAMEVPLASDGVRIDIVLGIGVSTRVTPD